jgi:hypothetical protein
MAARVAWLPGTPTMPELLALITAERLTDVGIGYVDLQLLAGTRLAPGAALWALDRQLQAAAHRMGVAFGCGDGPAA